MAIRLRQVARPVGWWYDALLFAALAALTLALAAGALLDLDVAIRDWADSHRPEGAYWVARVVNYLGQGGIVLLPVSAGLAVALAVRLRSPRPLLVVAVAFAATYVTIGPLKVLTHRAYPHDDVPDPERLFNHPVGDTSYPSGHVVNAIVWYGVIVLLVRALLRAHGRPAPPRHAVLTLRVAPAVIVFAATTYLGFHWFTDSVAAVLLGLLIARTLTRLTPLIME